MGKCKDRTFYDWENYARKASLYKKYTFCVFCQKSLKLTESTLDHYIPLGRGGSNENDNLVLSCKKCNHEKSDLLPLEYIQRRMKNEQMVCITK